MQNFWKKSIYLLLIFPFCLYSVEDSEIIKYEDLVSHASVISSEELHHAVKKLREFYIQKKDSNKLKMLNQKLAESFSKNARQKELLYLLFTLEDISYRLGAKSPDSKDRERITEIIEQLKKLRWYERDVNRSMSYIAIARAYYLLKDYQMAIAAAGNDVSLQLELDKKAQKEGKIGNSPRVAFLFLIGMSNQALADQENELSRKKRFLSRALEAYYSLVTEYPSYEMAIDARSRYEYCRLNLEKISGGKIISLANFTLKTSRKKTGIPPNIQIMVRSGNYSDAIAALKREISIFSPENVSLEYFTLLTELCARIKNYEEMNSYLCMVEKYSGSDKSSPFESTIICAKIVRGDNLSESIRLCELCIQKYPRHKDIPYVKWMLAEDKFNLLKKRPVKDFQQQLSVKGNEIANLYIEVLSIVANVKKQYYIAISLADLYHAMQNYSEAGKYYALGLNFSNERKGKIAMKLSACLYAASLSKTPADRELLRKARQVLKENETYLSDQPETILLQSKIYEAEGNKKVAADQLLQVIKIYKERGKNTSFLQSKMITLFYESGDKEKAMTLLKEMSSSNSHDISRTQFQIGKDLMKHNRIKEASYFFHQVLIAQDVLSVKELMFLVDRLFNAKGNAGIPAWQVAFRAGKKLENQQILDKKSSGNIRLKTATSAMLLKNYSTALELADRVLKSDIAELYLPAKMIKAKSFMSMKKYELARYELTAIALVAARKNLRTTFLQTKIMIAETFARENNTKRALQTLDSLLLPLKIANQHSHEKLPEIYKTIIKTAEYYAEKMENFSQLQEYKKLRIKYKILTQNGSS